MKHLACYRAFFAEGSWVLTVYQKGLTLEVFWYVVVYPEETEQVRKKIFQMMTRVIALAMAWNEACLPDE